MQLLSQPDQVAMPSGKQLADLLQGSAPSWARHVTATPLRVCVVSLCVVLPCLCSPRLVPELLAVSGCSPTSARRAPSTSQRGSPFATSSSSGSRGPPLSTSLSLFLPSVPLIFTGHCSSYLLFRNKPFLCLICRRMSLARSLLRHL